jgi:hypothetical protein
LNVGIAETAIPARLLDSSRIEESQMLGPMPFRTPLQWQEKLFKAAAIVCLNIPESIHPAAAHAALTCRCCTPPYQICESRCPFAFAAREDLRIWGKPDLPRNAHHISRTLGVIARVGKLVDEPRVRPHSQRIRDCVKQCIFVYIHLALRNAGHFAETVIIVLEDSLRQMPEKHLRNASGEPFRRSHRHFTPGSSE